VIERRVSNDYRYHNLLDRPRDAAWRTAIGMGVLTWTSFVFFAGASDRVDVLFGLSYTAQIEVYRVLVWVLPVLVGGITYRVCLELKAGERVEKERKRAEREARAAAP